MIEAQDFDFYAKLGVPEPLTCADCRFQRRMMFRNERTLYKRNCGLCDKSIVTVFSPEAPQPVYCPVCWYSDKWDPCDFGQKYDPSLNFFEQMKELQKKVPCMGRIVDGLTLVRSDYINHAGSCKDCYLIFNADFSENVLYSTTVTHVKDSMEVIMSTDSELLYEVIDCSGSKVFFSENCNACVETSFSKDCSGCINCFGCVGMRNKSYHIFNEPYSKEEYDATIASFRLDTYAGIQMMKKKVREFWLTFPRRAYYGTQNANSSGDYIYECKNAKNCYQAIGAEDSAYCQFLTLKSTRDCYDMTEWGMNSEKVIDSITVGENCINVRYCAGAWANCENTEYCIYVVGAKDCFGSINMRKKQYCILNKQYTKEEYETLRAQIIEDMNARPYVDQKGRVFPYGEFLPYDLSFYDYNEAQAAQYFPMNEEEARDVGFRWKAQQTPQHAVTLLPDQIPESIRDVGDSILQEVLGCTLCEKPYRIVNAELSLLRRFDFPIPRKCPDCRFKKRFSRVNSPKLYDRECAKCGKGIKTSYSPDRPEIVYCESCYQQEVL